MPLRFWLGLILASSCMLAHASGFVIEENLILDTKQTEYLLSHQNIVHHSESVMADSLILIPQKDYLINYKSGTLIFYSLPETGSASISYLILPAELSKPVYRYESFVYSDSVSAIMPKPNLFTGSSDLMISGSKTFALSFSESGETDLLQSLYVNLSGELSKGLNITAQLSDSQSKLSPEGDSKELSSLDQVFIRVYAKDWEIGMGDLDLSFENSRYLSYKTKLEGIAAAYNARHQAQAAYSAGGGKSASVTIDIIDGKQGPYYLVANAFQRSFIVVAGSEEIYLDGRILERGSDYYIDYAEGSVMFRSLVTSSAIVNASFQFSEENYRQSTYFNSSRIALNDYFSISHHLIHQNDAKDQPLLYSFTPADLDSLSAAGDSDVFTSGIIETETGNGSYKLLISPEGEGYFEYAPTDSTAIYDLVFSYVGPGNGDYQEFSLGKFRWVGSGNGAYLPLKRLIPPVKRSNIELGLAWQYGAWNSGFDALYSHNDRNTFSDLDDNDNSGGIFSWYLQHREVQSPYNMRLMAEHRLADTYRFSSDGQPEHDFSALVRADSLAQSTVDLSFGFKGDIWQPELMLRLRDLDEQYSQRALRFSSRSEAYGLLPQSYWQSTISLQQGKLKGTMQYHNAEATWRYRALLWKLSGLLNTVENDAAENPDTQFMKLQPAIGINGKNHSTMLSFTMDESRYRINTWTTANSSDTYSLLHNSSFENHSLDLDFSHRDITNPQSEESPKSSYELVKLRGSHKFLKGALSFFNNYQLNQTEFFPKIRDLVYVGQGLGIYDSTGVIVDSGDYNYEFITAPSGQLSTEISALSSIYLKPALYWSQPIWRRIQSDVSLSGTEQRDIRPEFGTYLFLPQHSFDDSNTIYGRQSYLHNLWLDLYQSKIIANLNWELSRDLDRRYQSAERGTQAITALQLDTKGYWGVNNRFELRNERSKESRYDSDTSRQMLKSSTEIGFSPVSTAQTELTYQREQSEKQSDAEDSYLLQSISVSPSLRSVLMQKYRISGRTSLGYNFRQGTDYLNFLPQKRKGWFSDGQLMGIYRMNSYSTFSLEYRYSKYPDSKSTHNLKLEFKAEL
jgi:hypothetical protein